MTKKKLTKEEKKWQDEVRELGCIVCYNLNYGESPAEIHHPREFAGAGMKSREHLVIPLCATHHRIGGIGVAIHAGEKEFERLYGSEAELLNDMLELKHRREMR